LVRIKLVLGSTFTNGHHALIADVSRHERTYNDQNPRQVKYQYRPFFPLQQLVSVNVPYKIDHKKYHDHLEPCGIVYIDSGGFCAVLAFHKCTDGHCRSKNQKKNGHKSRG